MFTHAFDHRVRAAVAVVAGAGLVGMTFGLYALWPSNLEAGYAPEQPIPFNHVTHAGTLKIPCLYCHAFAEKGPNAGIPSVSACMNCHATVKPKDAQGNIHPDVVQLATHWENRTPIVWVKVSDLADFAYFDHSRHLAAGATCVECHGRVETMDRVRREYGLKMGWCLDCHRLPPSPGRSGAADAPAQRASTTCTTCHR